MTDSSITHNTFVVEQVFSASPERVFQAFADPAQKRHWFAEGDHHDVVDYTLDFSVGGCERLEYRFRPGTPFPGATIVNDGSCIDIIANELIVNSHVMRLEGRMISATLATVEFQPEGAGTRLVLTHQAAFFEPSDGPKLREAGWLKLFDKLDSELMRVTG